MSDLHTKPNSRATSARNVLTFAKTLPHLLADSNRRLKALAQLQTDARERRRLLVVWLLEEAIAFIEADETVAQHQALTHACGVMAICFALAKDAPPRVSTRAWLHYVQFRGRQTSDITTGLAHMRSLTAMMAASASLSSPVTADPTREKESDDDAVPSLAPEVPFPGAPTH